MPYLVVESFCAIPGCHVYASTSIDPQVVQALQRAPFNATVGKLKNLGVRPLPNTPFCYVCQVDFILVLELLEAFGYTVVSNTLDNGRSMWTVRKTM